MLKRIYVDNIRCLSNFELTPGAVSVLVGSNGTGKSTVFDVLKAALSLLGPNALSVQELFGPMSRTRWDSRSTQRVELDVEVSQGELFSYALEIEHDDERRHAVIRQERLTAHGQLLYSSENGEVQLFNDGGAPTARFPVDPRRSFLAVVEPGQNQARVRGFKQWLAGAWLFRLRPVFDAFSNAEEEAIRIDGTNFVSWYRKLQSEMPGDMLAVKQDLVDVILGLREIRLVPAGTAKMLVFECELAGNTFRLASDELSDGQRALLVLYTILRALASRATLLVFDEPDNFLAEAEIQPWLVALREGVTQSERSSLMVMSHHPEVIDYVAADQVLALTRELQGPARVRELEIDRAAGLRASEWLRLGAASGSV